MFEPWSTLAYCTKRSVQQAKGDMVACTSHSAGDLPSVPAASHDSVLVPSRRRDSSIPNAGRGKTQPTFVPSAKKSRPSTAQGTQYPKSQGTTLGAVRQCREENKNKEGKE